MASLNNVPRDVLDSMRDSLDRRVKLSIKRLVNYETRKEKLENRVLAFSTYRLFIFTAKSPTKVETNFHYLEIKSIESKRPNHLVITTENKTYTFTTLEADYVDEVNHMITHIGTALKTIFPKYPLERIIKKIEVQPSERLKVMYDLMKGIEQKETGPCGGFTLMYSCMCDFHGLTYRDEVAWDVDTIYLSQDSRELCLRDFDHLKERDLIPIVSSLVHNTWFTGLNANGVKLTSEVCNEILRVMKKNAVIESLLLSNTGISSDFVKRLSNTSMTGAQLHRLDLSSNSAIDDIGVEHLIGAFSSRGKRCTWLDLSNTKVTTRGLNKISEAMTKSPHVFSCLQTLKLAYLSGGKTDDLQNLYTFLASPNMISHLDLSGTELEIDKLMTPLQRGCSQNIAELKLSRVSFSKKNKEVSVQPSFKQFFASVFALKQVDFSYVRLPPDALKDLFLGISTNRNLQDVHMNITGAEISAQGLNNLQNCLSSVRNISRLDITCIVKGPNSGLTDKELTQLLESIGQNNSIKQLAMGQVFQSVKPKTLKTVMEKLVEVLQADDSAIESLSLADSKLKDSMNMIINALGSNMSLTELDISGNQMGDLGARMLSKALQINNKLETIIWDKNLTTCQGFEDVANALEKNYTVRKMPVPVYDASTALRSEPQRTEQALQTIERLLQRNHSPQKYSSDQAYRLQQGFLISSTQQMVDRLVVQSQDTINALTMDSLQPYSKDVDVARAFIKDADKTKTLLPHLHDIAIQSQNTSSPVSQKLKEISEQLKSVLEAQMQKTVKEMLESTAKECKGIMKEEDFQKELRLTCSEKSALPKDFTSNILNGVDTEIFNKLGELNLAVAAHVSDRVVDEVIMRLTHCHKTLTNHLNEKKKGRSVSTSGQESPQESPKMHQRKSMLSRRVRPQSVIDKDQVQLALERADKLRPTTVPQTSQSGSRSCPTRDPGAGLLTPKREKPEKPSKSPKSSPRSKSKSPVPKIAVTFENDLDPDPIYDNAVPAAPVAAKRRHKKQPCSHGNTDGLDSEPELSLPPSASSEEFDSVPDLPTEKKLHNVTKDRPRVKRNVRPTTRSSAVPSSKSADNLKVDEGIDSFFSNSTGPSSPITNGPKADDSSSKSSSTKSTPESKKRGIFNFGSKEKDNKEKETKKQSSGGFGGLFKKSPKPSPVIGGKKANRVSDVVEEDEDQSANNSSVLRRSTADKSPLRSSTDRKSDKAKDDAENNSLKGSLDRKTPKPKGSPLTASPVPETKVKPTEPKPTETKAKPTEISESVKEDSVVEEKKSKEEKVESDNESDKGEVKDKQSDKGEVKDKDETKKKPEEDAKRNSVEKKPGTDKVNEDTGAGDIVVKLEKKDSKSEAGDSKVTEKKTEESVEKVADENVSSSAESKEADTEKNSSPGNEESEESPKPEPVKRPGIPGGIGFGGDLMAQLKLKQEKRSSMAPARPPLVDKKPTPISPSEEKKAPFGLPKLKPVNPKPTSSVKESDSTASKPVKPSDIKPSTPPKVDSPVSSKKGTDTNERKTAEITKKPSLKDEAKPAVVPRPSGLGRPLKPKPPPPSSKPTPAPRKSMNSEGDIDESAAESTKPEKNTVESGVVYDSATLKKSVKDKISMFKHENEANKGTALSQSHKEHGSSLPPAVAPKILSSSLPKDVKSTSLPMDTKPEDILKADSPEAGDLPHKTVEDNTSMTDSGIVYDDAETPGKSSVKDAAARFSGDASDKKSGSLPRNASPSGMKDSPATAGRPKSMFALVDGRPDLKKKVDTKKASLQEEKHDAPEPKSDGSRPSSDEVILV